MTTSPSPRRPPPRRNPTGGTFICPSALTTNDGYILIESAGQHQDRGVTLARVLSGAWWLLRRGGCLAVLAATPEPASVGSDLSTVVQAAHQIGYRYLQHVVAIDAAIIDDQLHTGTVAGTV